MRIARSIGFIQTNSNIFFKEISNKASVARLNIKINSRYIDAKNCNFHRLEIRDEAPSRDV